MSRPQYLQTVRAATQASQSPAWLIGLVIAFAALALLNTALMATAGRRAKLSLVRLIGATRRQARRMIAWEALITTLAGLAVGALIAGAAVQIPPGQPGWHITVPPALSGKILGGAALLGLAGTPGPRPRRAACPAHGRIRPRRGSRQPTGKGLP